MHIHSILEKETNSIILINTFIVKDSSKQQKVADMLENASKQIISKHYGFISTRIHKSLDGTKVMSYVQWENIDAIEKMLNDPSAIIHMNDIASMAKAGRTLYELVFTEEKI
jgi:heme-degrading monooxygenase HmoA